MKIITKIIPAGLALFLATCASPPARIEVQTDPETDFSVYRSFNFVAPMLIEDSGWPEAYGGAFRSELSRQLTERGLEMSQKPDLLINVAAGAKRGQALESDPVQTIHPQRGTFYDSWRGYGHGYGASTTTSAYFDGTFDIGMVDTNSRKLVWEGIASRRVARNPGDEEIAELVDELVTQLLAEFPAAGGD